MKNKITTFLGQFQNSVNKIVERGEVNTPNAHIYLYMTMTNITLKCELIKRKTKLSHFWNSSKIQ